MDDRMEMNLSVQNAFIADDKIHHIGDVCMNILVVCMFCCLFFCFWCFGGICFVVCLSMGFVFLFVFSFLLFVLVF